MPGLGISTYRDAGISLRGHVAGLFGLRCASLPVVSNRTESSQRPVSGSTTRTRSPSTRTSTGSGKSGKDTHCNAHRGPRCGGKGGKGRKGHALQRPPCSAVRISRTPKAFVTNWFGFPSDAWGRQIYLLPWSSGAGIGQRTRETQRSQRLTLPEEDWVTDRGLRCMSYPARGAKIHFLSSRYKSGKSSHSDQAYRLPCLPSPVSPFHAEPLQFED